MLPSPSLGPPLLSVSESPPLFWGILDVDELDEAEPDEDDAAGALEDVDEELDEPPPQPATTRHASTSAPAAHRLIEPLVVIICTRPPFRDKWLPHPKRTSIAGDPS
jgi:hypothetical protein